MLLNSIEDSIMADHYRMLLPILAPELRLELFDQLLKYELPWILKDSKAGSPEERLIAMYKKAMENKKNG